MISGSMNLYTETSSSISAGFSVSSGSKASVRNADGRLRRSACFCRNESHCVWNSTMIEISTRPICGIVLPFIAAMSMSSHLSPGLPLKSHVKPR